MTGNDQFEQSLDQLAGKIAREAVVTTFSALSGAMIGFAVGGPAGFVAGAAVAAIVGALADSAVDRYQSVPNPGGLNLFRSDKDFSVKFLGADDDGESYYVDGAIVAVDYETCAVTITGTSKNDTMTGCRRSDDKLFGAAGHDRISGQDGVDRINGDAGNDRLWGDGGNDLIRGGADSNTAYGGTGNDNFYIQNKAADGDIDSLYGGSGKMILCSMPVQGQRFLISTVTMKDCFGTIRARKFLT